MTATKLSALITGCAVAGCGGVLGDQLLGRIELGVELPGAVDVECVVTEFHRRTPSLDGPPAVSERSVRPGTEAYLAYRAEDYCGAVSACGADSRLVMSVRNQVRNGARSHAAGTACTCMEGIFGDPAEAHALLEEALASCRARPSH